MSSSSGSLSGRVAIVTGASSKIGEAISTQLAKAGVKVAMAARKVERLEQIKSSIAKSGGSALAVECDVTSRRDVRNLVKFTEKRFGPIDILVNNAGVFYYSLMKNLREDEWHHQVDVNCKGLLNCIGSILDGMIQRKHGYIVNISCDAGQRGMPGLAIYSGSKFFVEGMTQGMATELANTGVKVTCIQTGDVNAKISRPSSVPDDEALEVYGNTTPSNKKNPEDIATAVLQAVS